MPRLELAMLGPFRAILNGHPIETFHYEKVRALLAYLAAGPGQAHSRAALAELLWPDRPEPAARQNLSQALATLRRVLGGAASSSAYLIATNQQIRLDCDADIEIDAVQFEGLLAQCEEHRHVSLSECDSCLGAIRKAIDLYRGDFLQDLVVADAAEFHEWLLGQQAWYSRLATRALGTAAGAYEQRGQYPEALEFAQRRLRLTPWQEDSHRQVMRLLALSGRRLEALRQFEVCRDTMRTEMDIEPETETLALYERIRGGSTLEPATQGTPHNLEAQLTPLLGRRNELATLTKCLRDSDCRLVVLVGQGGSGKSRLAVEAAQHLLADFGDGAYFVPMGSMNSVESLVPKIAQTIGLNLYDASPPKTQLLQYLKSKRMLLILDSFEHLLDGAPEISRLLRATQHLKILVTSRARLNLQAEQVVRLEGLEIAAVDEDSGSAGIGKSSPIDGPAVRLFLHQARRSLPHFSPNADEQEAIVRTCSAVDGMPLSILLAASWMDVLDVEEMARRVSGETTHAGAVGLDFLETDWGDVPPRQRSMRAVLDHSWQLLDDEGKSLLARLSVFRPEFSAAAARQITGATLRQLKALVDRSMLESTQAGRYSLHEHLRQYAAERLDEMSPQAVESVASLHAAHYLHRLHECGKALQDARQMKAASEITSDFENMRAAWRWSSENGRFASVAEALGGLCHYLMWKYRIEEGRALCEIATEQLRASSCDRHTLVLAEALIYQAAFCRRLGQLDVARHILSEAEESVANAEASSKESRRARAHLLNELAQVTVQSMPSEAEAMYRASLALYRELGAGWEIAQGLNDLAHALEIQAEYDQVQLLCEEALQLQRRLGDRRGTIRSLTALCSVADNRGQIEEAIAYLQESKQAAADLADLHAEALTDLHLAIEHMYLGRFAEACSIMETAARSAEKLGATSLHAGVLHFLAWSSINLGKYGKAREYDAASLALFSQIEDMHGIAYVHLSQGESLLAEGQTGPARHMLQRSVQEFRRLDDRDGACLALITLVCTDTVSGNLARARQNAAEALAIASDTSDYGPLLGTVTAVSLLKAMEGARETAVELYALACRHPYIGKSIWRKHVVGRHIEEAGSALTAEVRANARRRGEARDLAAIVRELCAEFNK